MPSDINSTCLQIQGLVNFNYTSYRYVIWHLLSLSFNFYYVLRSVGGAAGSAFLSLDSEVHLQTSTQSVILLPRSSIRGLFQAL
jgi:hypothetical protein